MEKAAPCRLGDEDGDLSERRRPGRQGGEFVAFCVRNGAAAQNMVYYLTE